MATLALAVAGSAIGGAIGGTFLGVSAATIGWSVGSMLGAALFSPKTPDTQIEGPRLGEAKIQSSTYGVAIPRAYGANRIAGNLIWSAGRVETAHTSSSSGGKGGGGGTVTQTSYTYSQSFALALCEGPIVGVRKIWANGKLIYNLGTTADIDTIIASNKTASAIRFYLGSTTQLPDSLIEANVGVGSTPAYRDTAYVVFDTMQLAPYGNALPNLEFEVIVAGSQAATTWKTIAAGASATWQSMAAYGSTAVAFNYGTIPPSVIVSVDSGETWQAAAIPSFPFINWHGGQKGLIGGAGGFMAVQQTSGQAVNNYVSWYSSDGISWRTIAASSTISECGVATNGSRFVMVAWGGAVGVSYTSDGGNGWVLTNLLQSDSFGAITWATVAYGGGRFVALTSYAQTQRGYVGISSDGEDWAIYGTWPTAYAALQIAWDGTVFVAIGSGPAASQACLTSPDGVTWTPQTIPQLSAVQAVCSEGDGRILISATDYSFYSTDHGVTWTTLTGPTSTCYGACACAGAYLAIRYNTANVYRIVPASTVASSDIALSSIVSDICTRASLTGVNVAALTDTFTGYLITQRTTARAQIEPLMKAFYFDAIEVDGSLKYVKRGGTVAATILEDDMACHTSGSEMPMVALLERTQDIELPYEVVVGYLDKDADYQINTQYARRLIGASRNKISTQVPMALSGSKAKQISDVLIYDAWSARVTLIFATSNKWSHLVPSDLAYLQKGSSLYLCRLVTKSEQAGVISWSALFDDTQVYSQSGNAAAIAAPAAIVRGIGVTKFALLDIPLLRDQDDGIGLYSAACGYTTDWPGCQIFRSTDSGASWNSWGQPLPNPASIGSAKTALGNFTGNVFDEINSVTVFMVNGTLSSTTEINVLNGANVALLGSEIIQFKNATLIAAKTYTLTGLLRGRRGTEYAQSMHVIGDLFVLLDPTAVRLQVVANSEVGILRLLRAVTFGKYIDDAASSSFTFGQVAAKPYAPVLLGGGRDAAGNITINWVRRSRLSADWTSYADVPISETTESYDIEIWNSTYTVLKRTFAANATPTVAYSSANQVTDFGSNQATIYVRVYQNSSVIGRGFKLEGTV